VPEEYELYCVGPRQKR